MGLAATTASCVSERHVANACGNSAVAILASGVARRPVAPVVAVATPEANRKANYSRCKPAETLPSAHDAL